MNIGKCDDCFKEAEFEWWLEERIEKIFDKVNRDYEIQYNENSDILRLFPDNNLLTKTMLNDLILINQLVSISVDSDNKLKILFDNKHL